MKKIISFVLIIFSISLNSQSWDSIINTEISNSNITYMENFVNAEGIHLTVLKNYTNSNSIVYYLINLQGQIIRSTTITTDGEYPNIVGNNDEVYVVYLESGSIKVKKTTDSGQSWSNGTANYIGTNACSGLDVSYEVDYIHAVWAISDQYGYNSEVNYKKYICNNYSWIDYYNITNNYNTYGINPTITLSTNRIHVGYNDFYYFDGSSQYFLHLDEERSRTKYLTTWQSPQQITDEASRGILKSDGGLLYDFYYKLESGMGQYRHDLYYKFRSLGSSTWSSASLIEQGSDVTVPLSVLYTANGNIHLYTPNSKVVERIYQNGSLNNTNDISGNGWIGAIASTSAHNDIFVNWYIGTSNYLQLRHYDTFPSTPQSLTLTNYGGKPKLQWSKNIDADLNYYKIYRKYGSAAYALLATTSNLSYIDNTVTIVQPGGEAGTEVYYKITAIDKSNYESGYSNSVWCNVGGQQIESFEGETNKAPNEYTLKNNYPNPFNPSTTITYTLPESGFVNLKVYDMLGNEIAELVNEKKEGGIYFVEFDASDLPSGVYVYSIRVNDFVQNIKMTLLK